MNSSLEIVKAYCALKRIKISDENATSVLSGIDEYEKFKAIYDKTKSDFSFRACVYSSKKLSIFMEVAKHEVLPCVSKKKTANQGEFFIGNFLFKFMPNEEETAYIQHFGLHGDKPSVIKSQEQLRLELFNSFGRIGYWTRTKYKLVQKFLGVDPERFEEHKLAWGVKRVVKVFERNNTRYYFYEQESYPKRARLKFATAKPEHACYNYIDEGRHYSDNVFFEMDINPELMTTEIINEIERASNNNVVLVTKDLFDKFQSKHSNKAKKEEVEKKYKEGLINKAKKGFDYNGMFISIKSIRQGCKKLQIFGKEFTNLINNYIEFEKKYKEGLINKAKKGFDYNGILISSKAIRQGGKKLQIFGKDFANLIQNYIEFEKKPAFDDIVEDFIRYLDSNERETAKVQLGIHKLSVERIIKRHDDEKIKINGIPLGHCEYQILLRKIYRIKTQNGLAKYLRNVSSYGFVLADKLNKDIFLKISNDNKDEYIKFKIRGIKGKMFIDNGELSLLINNASFLNTAVKESWSRPSILDVIKYLIEDGNHESQKVLRFLREARRSYSQAKSKSIKYLKDAAKETNAKRTLVEIDGKKVSGYIVKGTLSQYFVTNDAKVYRLPSKKYVCIYDPEQNFFVNDTIGNRLYTLKDDMNFKESIKTLRADSAA